MSDEGNKVRIVMDKPGCCFQGLLHKLTLRDVWKMMRCINLEDNSSTDSRLPKPNDEVTWFFRMWMRLNLPPKLYLRVTGTDVPWSQDYTEYIDFKKLKASRKITVYAGLFENRDEECCIKIVENERNNRKIAASEIEYLTRLKHKNVMVMYTYIAFQNQIWIITELTYGSLRTMMKQREEALGRQHMLFSECTIATIIKGILEALTFIHSQKVIHRDVTAENVFIGPKGEVRLGNFGFAVPTLQNGTAKGRWIHTPKERRRWMAPEILANRLYSGKADVWCVGILILELILGSGLAALDGYESINLIYMSIMGKAATMIENMPPVEGMGYGLKIKDFLNLCLTDSILRRPHAEHLLKEPFMKLAKSPSKIKKEIKRYPLIYGQFKTMKAFEKYYEEQALINGESQPRVFLPCTPVPDCEDLNEMDMSPLDTADSAGSSSVARPTLDYTNSRSASGLDFGSDIYSFNEERTENTRGYTMSSNVSSPGTSMIEEQVEIHNDPKIHRESNGRRAPIARSYSIESYNNENEVHVEPQVSVRLEPKTQTAQMTVNPGTALQKLNHPSLDEINEME